MDGTVIKQIREDKNLTLEATYFGVCSKRMRSLLNREKEC